MRKRFWKKTLLSVAVLFVLSCVTVNVYFPAKEVEQAANDIVKEIRPPEPASETTPPKSGEQGWLQRNIMLALSVSEAHAQGATGVNTPTIRALKDSLKQRDPLLKPYFDNGNIGEGSSGRVIIRNNDGLDLKKTNQMKSIVISVNKDRDKLYAEVSKALNIDPTQANKVSEEFARFWQQYSQSGWWIQQANGSWAKK